MTEAAAAAPAARAVGMQRGPWFVALIGLVTLGIYWIYWYYKTGEEVKNYSGEGLGGVLWLVIAVVIRIVMSSSRRPRSASSTPARVSRRP